jgi:PAS domain S-box-containing protein
MSQSGQSLLPRYLGSVFGTLRGQLILSVALLNAVMMTLFVWYLTERQQEMLLERQTEHASALANSIATSSSGWLAAQDYSGLQEIIDAQRRYPDLVFAMILDPQGHVLAHSDTTVVGKYLKDQSFNGRHETQSKIVRRTAKLVDVVTPVVLAGTDIGWVRVGLGQETTAERLRTITRSGVINAIVAILIGSLAVAFLGWRLTRRLYAIQEVADAIQAGDRVKRVQLKGPDEAARLGDAFDAMLDTLAQRESELQEHRDHLSELVEERTAELVRQQVFTEAVLDNITDGVVACNKEGRLSYFNRATRLMHGIEREDLSPEHWTEHYRLLQEDGLTPMPTEQIPLYRAFKEEQVLDQPLIIEHTDGTRRFTLCSGQAMYNEMGEMIGAVVSIHDVTMQKEFEAKLIKARDEAEAANRAKSVFLANMSHELRTPLNAILGFSSLIQQDSELSVVQREHLDIINRSGEHLLTLINDVLEIAKIEAGKLQLEAAAFDLHVMVRDVADMMQLRAEQKGLILKLEQSSEFPRYIKTDEARLRQILVNLVGNAVKFTEKGGVILRLGKQQNEHLLIEVEDSGPGISPDDQARLFKPFVQLAENGEQKGTGLGLTITKQYVELIGGAIGIESSVGKGSIFRVELPIEPADAAAVIVNELAVKSGSIELAPGQPCYRILVVEDQLENQLLLLRLMTDIGMDVKLAENGEECIRIFEKWRPDLIWMDRRMPVMDGEEAARRVRQMQGGDQVKIIAVTASAFKEEHEAMIAAGMNEVVSKPYRFNEIYDSMARHLGLQFIYRDSDPDEIRPPTTLTPSMMAGIGNELQTALREALDSLNSEGILEIIQRISETDNSLAEKLKTLADNFDYPTILKVLDSSASSADKGGIAK